MGTPSSSRPLECSVDNGWVRAIYAQVFTSDTKTPIDWSSTSLRDDVDVLELDVTCSTFRTDDGRNDLASRVPSNVGNADIRDACNRRALKVAPKIHR
jgi:hypothetical protein